MVRNMSVREGNSAGFVDRLEALRGIASLWVAVGHALIWLSMGDPLKWTAAERHQYGWQAAVGHVLITIFNGNAAVDVFFVLSGFVLTKSLLNGGTTAGRYWAYAARRVFRILPAFWFSLFVVGLYLAFAYPGHAVMQGASSWFNQWYERPLDTQTMIDNLTFVSPWLNPNAWTLKVEIVLSLALPFVVWILARGGVLTGAAVLVASIVSGWFARDLSLTLSPLHYVYMFVAGAVLAKHASVFDCAPRWTPNLAAILGALLIVCSNQWLVPHSFRGDVVITIGAVCLIWASTMPNAKTLSLLDKGWAKFLGRISYSFYLLHFIVLYAVANLMLHVVPSWLIVRLPLPVMLVGGVVMLLIAVPLSMLSFTFVEKPFTLFGKRLSSAMDNAIATTAKTQ